MKALDLKKIFHKELDVIYDVNEVDSFFNLCLEHFLDIHRIQLQLDSEFSILKKELDGFFSVLDGLKQQIPIQYILGETEFFELKFSVNPNVLIPRQETEELVSLVLQNGKHKTQNPKRILDIGTGSGCIAISLAKHLDSTEVYALDVSKDALRVAKENATSNEVNINFIHADILDSDHCSLFFKDLEFDIIVSNPPYVRHQEKAEMLPNVLENEPHLALFVEDDSPLLFYKAITKFAVENLKPNGQLFFEINQYLGQESKQILVNQKFKDIELLKDLNGNYRILKGTWN